MAKKRTTFYCGTKAGNRSGIQLELMQDSFRPACSQIQSYIINTLSNGELEMTSRLAWRKFQYGSLSRVCAYYRPCPQI